VFDIVNYTGLGTVKSQLYSWQKQEFFFRDSTSVIECSPTCTSTYACTAYRGTT